MITISKLAGKFLYKNVEPKIILFYKMSMNRKLSSFQQISLQEIIFQNNKKVAFINAKLSRGQASLIQLNIKYIRNLFKNFILWIKGKPGTELGPHLLKSKFLYTNLENLGHSAFEHTEIDDAEVRDETTFLQTRNVGSISQTNKLLSAAVKTAVDEVSRLASR